MTNLRLTVAAMVGAVALTGCGTANVIQTSANTAVVQSSAAPACGSAGAARLAQREAAAATLRAGFDRYIITSVQAANNVQMVQGAGTYSATAVAGGGFAGAQTTYQPGPMIVAGSHDASFGVVMFRNGDAGSNNAIDARTTLGPEWREAMNRSRITC